MRLLYNISEDDTEDAVYIGRGSVWGNPYSHIPGKGEIPAASRDDAVNKYRAMVNADPALQARIVEELKGKKLMCWCYPKRCHGEVLIQVANYEP